MQQTEETQQKQQSQEQQLEQNEQSSPEQMLQKVKQLQSEAKYFECLELMEKIIPSTHQKYGSKSKQYIASQEKMCEICNQVSMLFLTKDKKQLAYEFLKRSETLSSTSPQLQIITFNNFSCYYKKIELYTQAIEYLQKAINIGNRNQIYRNLADSYLNLCSINSQQNKHKDALQNVLMAIYLLQNEMVNFLESTDNNDNQNNEAANKKEIIYVLAVAYHNLGVELEYLKRYDEALAIYEKAIKFAIENLGKDHELVNQLKDICSTAKQQIENQKAKLNQKPKTKQNAAQFYMTQQNLKEMQKQYSQQGGAKNDKQSQKKQRKFNITDAFQQLNQEQQQQKQESDLLENENRQKRSEIEQANSIENQQMQANINLKDEKQSESQQNFQELEDKNQAKINQQQQQSLSQVAESEKENNFKEQTIAQEEQEKNDKENNI